ncbi:MAG: dethiobiotin synthase [Acidocella sp.]|nr:dethiobiotin synthase [Acidocella sp.]
MLNYFITATGTEIGKTYVTSGILRAAKAAGHNACAVKPILSGYDDASAATSDPALLLAAMGRAVTARNIAAISPWRYAAPLSPDMAARREGRAVDINALTQFCHAAMAPPADLLLIEGVGGIAVPLDGKFLVADWISRIGIPAVLVAGTYLGTISHSITAAEALLSRGITIAAIVLSESPESPVPPAETADVLGRFVKAPIHIIPRHLNDQSFAALASLLTAPWKAGP